MGSFFVESSTLGFAVEETRDEASVSAVRVAVREEAGRQGLPEAARESLATAASELAHNQLAHARLGVVGARPIVRDGVGGIEVVAADRGPGLADPAQAFLGLGNSEGSLGIGLAGVRRLCHELDMDVRLGEGTCIWIRAFAEPVPRAPEVGIFGRPVEGESSSGDGAFFARREADVLLAVADGLGHGDAARLGSQRALEGVIENPWDELDAIFVRANDAARGTRGAVFGLARLASKYSVDYLIVGDIRGEATRIGNVQRFLTTAGYLGSARRARHRVHTTAIEADDLVLLCSDGINSRLDLSDERLLVRQAPVVIAQTVVERYAKAHDDALVAVVR
jgi:anti-sigma regulatory factor (Ser/Thr protein kinase)